MRKCISIFMGAFLLSACGSAGKASGSDSASVADSASVEVSVPQFDVDSAMSYLRHQVELGPRVPNTSAHRAAIDWLAAELRRHGAEVTLQPCDLTAYDGTLLHAVNIMGSYNPNLDDRLLLLAHFDTRPWADQDPDPANHSKPIAGANDGASGVAVLLETARAIARQNPEIGIDILMVDAEDYGAENDEESWALGTKYFATHPIKPDYRPTRAILLDMVGGKGAIFPAEYFSRESAPLIDDAFRRAAAAAGHGSLFPARMGSAVTDDHVELIKVGIPAIDIIDYRDSGFCPTWHTLSDNLDNIDPATLKAVGESLLYYIYNR